MPASLPLMKNNITRDDLDLVIEHLNQEDPILTQSKNVLEFEKEWSEWLGVKHSVFVNSGSSANLLTLAALKLQYPEGGDVIVPPLTWVSDISSVIQNGFTPVFCDINLNNLCMNTEQVISKLTDKTRAVFMTYAQGFNGLTKKLLEELHERDIFLIEDVCESHGAMFDNKKLGAYGWTSNFSFYYAHHMSSIEGGIICTNDSELYQVYRMLRSHGMVRETTDTELKNKYFSDYPELNPEFIFAFPAYNVRNTEVGAIIARNQLKRLDENNNKRIANFELFLSKLNSEKYITDFDLQGSCNYAFNLIMRAPDEDHIKRLMERLNEEKVEFRRGSAGGGNQLRQPYLQSYISDDEYLNYPHVEHVHYYGLYIGNYPTLEYEKILQLCNIINSV